MSCEHRMKLYDDSDAVSARAAHVVCTINEMTSAAGQRHMEGVVVADLQLDHCDDGHCGRR